MFSLDVAVRPVAFPSHAISPRMLLLYLRVENLGAHSLNGFSTSRHMVNSTLEFCVSCLDPDRRSTHLTHLLTYTTASFGMFADPSVVVKSACCLARGALKSLTK